MLTVVHRISYKKPHSAHVIHSISALCQLNLTQASLRRKTPPARLLGFAQVKFLFAASTQRRELIRQLRSARGARHFHLMLLHPDHQLCAHVDELRLRKDMSLRYHVSVVVVKHELVHIDLAHPSGDALTGKIVGKAVSSMDDNAQTPLGLLVDGSQPS